MYFEKGVPAPNAKYNSQDWIGVKFNNLEIIGIEHKPKKWIWRCRCDCGNETACAPYKVIHGKTKSCGCMKADRAREMTQKYRIKHGGRHERLYHTWIGMRKRCRDPKDKDYGNYGGRGINICDEWYNDYAAFRSWASSNGYSEGLTIDRIDVNGDYCPDNCRWATLSEQGRNKRCNKLIEINGEVKTLADWCDIYHMPYYPVHQRIHIRGWDAERALTTPIQKRKSSKSS